MAIQISGTSVIDNSRNLTNIVNATIGGSLTAGGSTGTSGQVLKSTGTGIQWGSESGSGAQGSIFTSPGTFTIGTNCPSSITKIKISCMGGGGNGGPSIAPSLADSAGGGGGASVLHVCYRTVSNGQAYTITVGGAAGTSSVTLPTASPTTIVSVPGGSSAPPNTGQVGVPLGPGGNSTSLPAIISPGGFSYTGGTAITQISTDGPAPVGVRFASQNGDGGTSYVEGPAATPQNKYVGGGGPSVLGYGGDGFFQLPNGTFPGNPATGYGSGGGGSAATSAAPAAGGTGAPGIVIIEW